MLLRKSMAKTPRGTQMTNPLLTMNGLPPFSQIKPEHIKPALDTLLPIAKARRACFSP